MPGYNNSSNGVTYQSALKQHFEPFTVCGGSIINSVNQAGEERFTSGCSAQNREGTIVSNFANVYEGFHCGLCGKEDFGCNGEHDH